MGVNYYILRESKRRGGGGFLSYMKKYIYIIYYIKEIMWQKFLTDSTSKGDARRFGGASGLYQSCLNWRLAKRRETLKNDSSLTTQQT